MSELRIKTLTDEWVTIPDESLAALQVGVRGDLLQPHNEGYKSARQVWNGMIDRRPALIVRCTGTADVIAAINFAHTHNLLLSVRGGGHNAAGYAVNEGGLVIDLSPMKGIRVDPQARRAWAAGGVTWGDLDHETQPFGLAVPGGVVSTTGIAGLTLGGGFGWLRRKYGLSCDNLLSADVVTVEGKLVKASETENADLFWALRGGGGNFGIVTSFEYRLYPVGPQVMAAIVFYPFEAAAQVMTGWRDFMATAPDEISSNLALWSIPPTPDWPEEMHWQPMTAVVAMYSGSVEEGQRAMQPLRQLATPLADASQPLPYTALQQMFDPFFPEGDLHYYWKSLNLNNLNDEAIEALIGYAGKRPSVMNLIDLWALGGAVSRVAATDTAFGDRSTPFSMVLNSCWADPADTQANIAWTRALWSAMQPFSPGSIYLNFPGLGEEGDALVEQAYGVNYERLVAIKQKYDPGNLLRMNQNIDPVSTAD
jgi:FAD/FMN-containing dehydrogenase